MDKIHIAAVAAILAIAAIVFLISLFTDFQSLWSNGTEYLADQGTRLLKKGKGYEKTERMLLQKGAVHMFGPGVTPLKYCILRAAIFLAVFLTAGMLAPSTMPLALKLALSAVIGLMATALPAWMLNISDEADQEQMLDDLKNVYNTLRMETHAGVYLTTALAECYLVVRNQRLKAALLDLTNDISATHDVGTAIEAFGGKFDDRYIDMFVVTIRQSLESGRSAQLLADVSEELRQVQKAINTKVSEALDRKLQVISLLMFVGMLVITIYMLMVSLSGSLSMGF